MVTTDLYSVLRDVDIAPAGRQFVGLPTEMSGPGWGRESLPRPRVLVIEYREDGIFLLRYTDQGDFAGDTWHLNLDDAKHQADHEYGELVGDWVSVPAGTKALALALSQIGQP